MIGWFGFPDWLVGFPPSSLERALCAAVTSHLQLLTHPELPPLNLTLLPHLLMTMLKKPRKPSHGNKIEILSQ